MVDLSSAGGRVVWRVTLVVALGCSQTGTKSSEDAVAPSKDRTEGTKGYEDAVALGHNETID